MRDIDILLSEFFSILFNVKHCTEMLLKQRIRC